MDLSSDETLHIDTPENIAFGYQISGIGSRFFAALLDSLLIAALQIVIAVVLSIFTSLNIRSTDTLSILIMGLVSFIFFWGYYVFFEVLWNGQSPGKLVVGLRVVRTDGTSITLYESLIRNLVRLVDFLPVVYGVGVIAMFLDAHSRRLGDLAAGTLVVYHRTADVIAPVREEDLSKYAYRNDANPIGFPVECLTPADIAFIEQYHRRRSELPNKYEIALVVANRLYRQAGLAGVPLPQYPNDFIDSVLAAVYARRENQNLLPNP